MPSRILVVEDDEEISEILQYNLTRAGHQVLQVADGAAGVETVRQEKPDLILLDIMLPRMNGWEVCRILADAPDLCEIPIIVFTAKDSLEDRAQARQFNLAGFFTKPYATVDVVRHVDKVLTVQAEARARQRAS